MSMSLHARLTQRIVQHVRENRLEAGQHLPAQTLADLFQVSRAPIQAALDALAKEGIVAREPNRGYFLRQGADALAARETSPAAEAADDEPYLSIAADRLDGALPERVTENELIRRYGLTRPAVVKIMARIAQEGWAERRPGHGWTFTPVLTSREAYDQGYRFRAAIESAALLEPGFRVDPAGLAALRAEQQALLGGQAVQLSRGRLFAANAGFHERIVEWSGNPFFLDALRRVNSVRRLLEYRLAIDRSRLERQCREHLELLDIIEAGDLVTGSAYLRVHIGMVRRVKTAGLA